MDESRKPSRWARFVCAVVSGNGSGVGGGAVVLLWC